MERIYHPSKLITDIYSQYSAVEIMDGYFMDGYFENGIFYSK